MLGGHFVVYTFNFIDRQIVSVLQEPIRAHFDLADWQLGLMTGFAFAFLYTILVPGIAATFIWFQLVKRIGAVRAATFHFLSPPLGVAIAAFWLGERFGWSDVIGSIIVAAGILMVQLSRVPAAPPYQAEDDIRAIHSASSAPARRTVSARALA